MSTRTTPIAQLMLPGQAAAPAGPADLTMMYVVHHAFRRDLHRFGEAVRATPLEDRETWRALESRWGRFFEVLRHHHSAEDDLIWPHLIGRSDPEEWATLAAMGAEHDQIDLLLAPVAEIFSLLAGDRLPFDAEELRAALGTRITAARDTVARHLEHEETSAIAILQRHTPADEWQRIEEQIGRRKSRVPLSFMVGWCTEGIPPRQLDQVFGAVGLPFKVRWLLTRGRFRRSERRTFTYAARWSAAARRAGGGRSGTRP